MHDNLEQLWLQESPDAAVITDVEGRVLCWNRGAAALFGFTAEEATGLVLDELIVPLDQRDAAEQMLRDTLANGAGTFEALRRPKDGTLRHTNITTKVIRNAHGRTTLVLTSIKDVTGLCVQRDARLMEAKFGRLLESTPDGIVLVNGTGRIVLANATAERLFGYAHGELRGRPVEELIPARFHGARPRRRAADVAQPRARETGAGAELHDPRQDGEEFPIQISLSPPEKAGRPEMSAGRHLELCGLRRDGSEFAVEIFLTPLHTEDGVLVSNAIRDVSERKRIEQALQEKNLELRNAAEAKNRFLASMSHELRTPLNGIIGFAEVLVDDKPGPLNPKQKEYLQDILLSGRHLLQLINDVLDLAKVEAGRMVLSPERFTLIRAINEVCAVARPLAQKKSVVLGVDVAPALGEVDLDQQKFKQILYHLLAEALKFTDESGRVDVQAAPDSAGKFVLAVKASGIGHETGGPPRASPDLEQLEAARRSEGSGLGLALTRRLVELQGGSFAVDSAAGHGGTFTVVLPRGSRAAPL